MKKFLYILLPFLFFISLGTALTLPVLAAVDTGIGQRVFDNAGLFTNAQQQDINADIHKLILKYKQDIVIVTILDAEGKSSMTYADDYYGYNGFGIGPNYDGLLLLLDMDNREFFITTSGSAIKIFNDAKIDNMLENIYRYVTKADYARGARVFLDDVDQHLTGKTPKIFQWSWEFFGLGFFVILVVMGSIIMNHKKDLMTTPSAKNYINEAVCDLSQSNDIFLHSNTRRIALNNNSGPKSSSNGSTTRTSSSGRTHGGSGRKF